MPGGSPQPRRWGRPVLSDVSPRETRERLAAAAVRLAEGAVNETVGCGLGENWISGAEQPTGSRTAEAAWPPGEDLLQAEKVTRLEKPGFHVQGKHRKSLHAGGKFLHKGLRREMDISDLGKIKNLCSSRVTRRSWDRKAQDWKTRHAAGITRKSRYAG